MTFTDVAEQAGVADGNDAANASADALWLDYDNDGQPDLLRGPLRAQPALSQPRQRQFTDVTQGGGLDRYLNAITAIAFDYDRDG